MKGGEGQPNEEELIALESNMIGEKQCQQAKGEEVAFENHDQYYEQKSGQIGLHVIMQRGESKDQTDKGQTDG